jgi:hypothetical protein
LARRARRDVAAIASERAGELYGLRVLARSMEGPLPTMCRFILLARDPLITSARPLQAPSLPFSVACSTLGVCTCAPACPASYILLRCCGPEGLPFHQGHHRSMPLL